MLSHNVFPYYLKFSYSVGSESGEVFGCKLVYAYQRFSLNAWNNFRISGLKLDRAKCSFKKNPDIAAFLQKAPNLYNGNYDRGHMIPYMNALSQKDQMEFNLQGNIFYQLDRQNRGEWKKIEMSIMKTMEELNVDMAHITTAVVYARENGNFVKQNDKL